jgi:hypothetical protein
MSDSSRCGDIDQDCKECRGYLLIEGDPVWNCKHCGRQVSRRFISNGKNSHWEKPRDEFVALSGWNAETGGFNA